MTALYPTIAERRSANAIARNFAEHAARTLREDAQVAINDTVRAVNKLRECGVSRGRLYDMLAGLLDEAAALDVKIERGLAGADPFSAGLDLSGVTELLGKVK